MEEIRLSFSSCSTAVRILFCERTSSRIQVFVIFLSFQGDRSPDDEHSSNTAIVLIMSYALYRQQYGTDNAAHHIGYQVRRSCLPAGQIHLMPLIKHTNPQRAEKCEDPSLPIRQSARHVRQQGENNAASQLVLRRMYQLYSNRLRSSDKQADHDPKREQRGHDAGGAR